MKNLHIKNLGQVVPAEIRLEIYKTALRIIEKQERVFGLLKDSYGLCLLLPCVLWNLDNYLSKAPDGNNWSYFTTSSSFPELTSKVLDKLNKTETDEQANKIRIKFLKDFIKMLENSLQS